MKREGNPLSVSLNEKGKMQEVRSDIHIHAYSEKPHANIVKQINLNVLEKHKDPVANILSCLYLPENRGQSWFYTADQATSTH